MRDKLKELVQVAVDRGWDTICQWTNGEDHLSIPDLILNADFMKAVYPGKFCTHWNQMCHDINRPPEKKCGFYLDCNLCNSQILYAAHVSSQAASLYLTEGAEKAVDYMYDNLPKEPIK